MTPLMTVSASVVVVVDYVAVLVLVVVLVVRTHCGNEPLNCSFDWQDQDVGSPT
jgi:hypothetical protein